MRNNGTVLVEGICMIIISQFTIIAFMLMLFMQVMQIWLDVECYTLARAHLYDNSENHCQLSSKWPHQLFFPAQIECDSEGSVSIQVTANFALPEKIEWSQDLTWYEKILTIRSAYQLNPEDINQGFTL